MSTKLQPTPARRATRQLTVELFATPSEPRFTFVGEWTGHDISVIIRHIHRAYFLRQRALRREATIESNSSEKQEVSND